MKITVFILIFVGIVISFLSENLARKKMMQKLLKLQQFGEEAEYLKTVESPMAKFFFDRTTRIIMRLNFFLAFGKTEKIDEESQELIKYGKRNRNFIITMMKIFNFYLENNQFDEALKIEKVLIPACKNEKYDSVNKEIKLLHRLYINKDPNLKSELKIELENVINPEEKMIILYRLTKICELMGEKHQANTYLNQLKIISKNQIKQINKAEEF